MTGILTSSGKKLLNMLETPRLKKKEPIKFGIRTTTEEKNVCLLGILSILFGDLRTDPMRPLMRMKPIMIPAATLNPKCLSRKMFSLRKKISPTNPSDIKRAKMDSLLVLKLLTTPAIPVNVSIVHPTHVNRDEIRNMFPELQTLRNKLIVMCCSLTFHTEKIIKI